MLPLIIGGFGTPVDNRGNEQVEDLSQLSTERWQLKETSMYHLLKMAGLIEESTVILGKLD